MKRFLLLWVVLTTPLWAQPTLEMTSAPTTVNSGQSYYIEARCWDSSGGVEVTIYKNNSYFASSYGTSPVYAGASTTDTGAQTVTYRIEAVNDYWETDTIYHTVTINQPNNPPTIEWVSPPSTAAINQNFTVQAKGLDSDGNLTNVFVWVDGTPFAFNGGGNGYQNTSDGNLVSRSYPGNVTFTAKAQDSNGASSATISHTVYVYNQAPTATWVSAPASAFVNDSFTVSSKGQDVDGNLTSISVWKNGAPFAINGGGNGYLGYSSANSTSSPTVGSVPFTTQAGDAAGGVSPVLSHNVSIVNREPHSTSIWADTGSGVTLMSNGQYSMYINTPITLHANIKDYDSNLVLHNIWNNDASGTANGPGTIDFANPMNNGVPSNAGDSTVTVSNFTPTIAGRWDFHSNGKDNAEAWSTPGASITVYVYGPQNKAEFVSLKINGTTYGPGATSIPVTMGNNASLPVEVTMRNVGSKPWTDPDPDNAAQPHKLGVVGDDTRWGPLRQSLPSSVIYPVPAPLGETDTATFVFNLTSDDIPKTNQTVQWEMLEEGIQIFPNNTPQTRPLLVTVTDTIAPNTPPGVPYVTKYGADFVEIAWTPAVDNSGQVTYTVYKDGTSVGTTANTTYTVSGLVLGNTYSLKVRATDQASLFADGGVYTLDFTFNPSADYDSDGVQNGWEQSFGLDPYSNDAGGDPDGDGMSNFQEYTNGTNPNVHEGGVPPAGWPTAVSGNSNVLGFTPGSFAVDASGASTYSIPIWVTPGTNGMQPTVAINYNSNGGNGYLGVGWGLSGIPVISRRNATLASDGFIGAVKLEATDRFTLDGSRLLLVSGTSGADGAEYRTERESFSRIYSYGTTGYGPERFVVKTKTGLTMEFGLSTASDGGRIMAASPAPTSAVVAWALDKITDVSGNYCKFYYTKNSTTGEFYISSIKYGDYLNPTAPYGELKFDYTSRTDIMSGYLGGAPWKRSMRLDKITSKYNTVAVRSYQLGYEYSPNTSRSRLTSVRELDANNNGLPAVTFSYKAETSGWKADNSAFYPPKPITRRRTAGWINGHTGSGFIDFNGDGLLDQLFYHASNSATDSGVAQNDGTAFQTTFTNSTSFFSPRILGYDGEKSVGVRFVDLNGDGYKDIIAARDFSLGGEPWKAVWLNTATGWSSSSSWASPFYIGGAQDPDRGVRFVDLDGDGLEDVMWARYAGNERGAKRNTGSDWGNFPGGTNFVPPAGVYLGDDTKPEAEVKLLDLNGDGLVDLVKNEWKSGSTPFAYLNTGTGWILASSYAPQDYVTGHYRAYVGSEFVDVNGDGLPDQVTYRRDYNGNVDYRSTRLNTGKGWVTTSDFQLPDYKFLGAVNTSSGGGNATLRFGTAFTDLNGDGLLDFIFSTYDTADPLTNQQKSYLNTGSGWTESTAYGPLSLMFITSVPQTAAYDYGVQFLDVNGDGMPDMIKHLDQPDVPDVQRKAYLNASKRPDLIDQIVESNGLVATLAYKYITDPSAGVYTKGTRGGVSFPLVDVQNPSYVVKTATLSDGVGGSYTLSYDYSELRHSFAEGNLGFAEVGVLDSRTNVLTTTTYSQTYPYIGLPVRQLSSTVGGELRDVTTQWGSKLHASNSRVAYPYAATVEEKIYEPTSSSTLPYLTKTTTTTCDATWGDPIDVIVETDDGYKTTEHHARTYASSPTYPGQMSTDTVTVTAQSLSPNPVESKVRTTKYDYDTYGRLEFVTIEPNDTVTPRRYWHETYYGRDGYGNINYLQTTHEGPSTNDSRLTTYEYGSTYHGRFPTKRTVGGTHVTNYDEYYPKFGVLKKKTEKAFNASDADLVTTYVADSLGRITSETRPDLNVITTARFWSSQGPSNSVYAVDTLVPGGAPSLEFFDALGRSVRQVTVTGDRQITKSDTTYNNRGLVANQTRPYVGGTPTASTTTTYDVLARPYTVATPTGTYTYDYDGYVTTVESPDSSYAHIQGGATYTRNNQSTETTRNSQGWIMKVVQSGTADSTTANSEITYTYDPFGALKTTKDSLNNTITYTPDTLGRTIAVSDPDRGNWSYNYYGTGELRDQTDAESVTTSLTYDAFGRTLTRTTSGGGHATVTASWTYDTAPGFGRGAVHSISFSPTSAGASESMEYNALGLLSKHTRTIDGSAYELNYTYDSYSRLKTTLYPSTLTVRRYYTGFGYLAEYRNNADYTLYWRGDEYTADGSLIHGVYGNGIETDRTYRVEDSAVTAIDSGRPSSPTEFQSLRYFYEPGTAGNLYKRQDLRQGVQEWFKYDGLVRMTEAWRKPDSGSAALSLSVGYNAIGNITSKDGSSYTYDPVRPHAVKTALGNTHSYNDNGELTGITGNKSATINWSARHKPSSIVSGATTISFGYDAANNRVTMQKSATSNKTVYVGKDYERQTDASGTVTLNHYLFTPHGRSVEIVYSGTTLSSVKYYLGDHLGSTDTIITDSNFGSPTRLSFNAWGGRRNDDWTAGAVSSSVRRGFTDHEMLDSYGLTTLGWVHMNGRIYDSVVGRFLSPDPLNQDIYSTQTYNAYSYVLNNPLSLTDPTGETAWMANAAVTYLAPFFVTADRVDIAQVVTLSVLKTQPLLSTTGLSLLLNPSNANNSFQVALNVFPSDEYLSKFHMNFSMYSYGTLRGAFYDLPVSAWELGKLMYDLNDPVQRAEMGIFVAQYTTDISFREQVNQAIKDSLVESWGTPENAMYNGGRVVGGVLAAKGLNELAATIKSMSKAKQVVSSAEKKPEVGSYTNTHASGKKYHGKGTEKRMNQSAREKAEVYDDPVVDQSFKSASSRREAFKDEARRIRQDGGVKTDANYNKINSPGEKYLKEDGE